MKNAGWHIYVAEIPYSREGVYWVSFESDPALQTTKANIYGRCLPCIQNLYEQLREGCREIEMGRAFRCWKVTAIVQSLNEALELLLEFERVCPGGHVYGKLGNGRRRATTIAVVFHTDETVERDRLKEALARCLRAVSGGGPIQISRGCAVLYDDLLGRWEEWQAVTAIKYPENVPVLLERIKKILYRSVM